MTNLLQRGATWLGGKLKTAGGRSVTYCRGSRRVTITATPQMHQRTVVGEDGIETVVSIYSWVIVAAELVLSGELVEPQRGDYMTETLNNEPVEWQLLPVNDSNDLWEWLDSSKILLLVHTKKV